jgi:uncharacterized protein
MALLCLAATVLSGPNAHGAEEEEAGFFTYFPAVPDINLPKLDFVPFWTSDIKKARKAYNSSDYARALTYFRKESEDGNPVADWYLGHMYRLGRGVKLDPAIAYSYYSRVAEAYDPDDEDAYRLRIAVDSQLHLTRYLREGVPSAGIEANPSAAARGFLRLASNYGHPRAMFELGLMNMRGSGVKQNPQQGLKWLITAARKRSPEAESYLGELYWKGEFVQRDETRALMWYTLAAETTREEDYPILHARVRDIRQEVSEEVRLEAEARAEVWAEQYPPPK